jgi:hypothetical protein
MDGCVVEIDAGVERLRFGPLLAVWGAVDGAAAEEIERLQRTSFEYRFVGLEDVEDPEETSEAERRAVFELVEATEGASAGDLGGESGA